MRLKEPTVRSEQGAVFVQVGISLFVLMAFNVFVLDYGMLWIGRRQAQNAADAGALAGGIARGYDDFDDPPSPGGLAANIAGKVAAANLIWQQPGTSVVSFGCPSGVTGKCVRVDVYRNGENGSVSLPTLFGPILGVNSQGVRATATAMLANGNATNCLRPLALPDWWEDNRSPSDEFNRYAQGSGSLLDPPDRYVPPSETQAVSASVPDDLGERINFSFWHAPSDPVSHSFIVPLDLPGPRTFAENLAGCYGQPIGLRQVIPIESSASASVTGAGFSSLIAQDSGAAWNYVDRRIENSCAPDCARVSPRLIAIALYDPDEYQFRLATNDWSACPGGIPCVTVRNIVGFFIHLMDTATFGHGHLLKYPGTSVSTAPTYVDEGSWLVTNHLIR